ncbi:MAG TPA: 2Fe-2S iron-sulfur cluster-binding protein [Chloroflexota bacterium]|jgi:xanthine dehydrogenase YagT iron-sulfur-binding subunit
MMRRREFLASSLSGAGALAVRGALTPAAVLPIAGGALPVGEAVPSVGPEEVAVTLRVNGEARTVMVDPRTTLLDALRERLALTGTKKGCDRGACTVLVDGQRINSCLTLAIMHEGQAITTIEGLAQGDDLHPVQAAFLECDAFQCGYCTPGQIMSAVALLDEGHVGSDAEIAEWMSGNICRCGAYNHILAAIQDVAQGGR